MSRACCIGFVLCFYCMEKRLQHLTGVLRTLRLTHAHEPATLIVARRLCVRQGGRARSDSARRWNRVLSTTQIATQRCRLVRAPAVLHLPFVHLPCLASVWLRCGNLNCARLWCAHTRTNTPCSHCMSPLTRPLFSPRTLRTHGFMRTHGTQHELTTQHRLTPRSRATDAPCTVVISASDYYTHTLQKPIVSSLLLHLPLRRRHRRVVGTIWARSPGCSGR